MYLLLITAAVMFAVQFLFNQKFTKSRGNGLEAMLCFSIYGSLMRVVLMLILSKFNLTFTWFSLAMSFVLAGVGILYTYFSLKAFSVANLSVFSIFAMLGGMMLPFVCGTMFYNEELTVAKIICCVLIAVALLLTFEKGKSLKYGMAYCIGVFILNGLSGVVSKVHQSSQLPKTDSYGLLIISGVITIIICNIWYIIKYKRVCSVSKHEFGHTSLYSVCCGLGNLFCLIALQYLPASVQYPIITGGTMFFSVVISIINREKINRKNIASAFVACLAAILIML